ncbi:YeeE/YedE family protein [Chitinimonas sp.]|uniref:YeeE/YedE family protein n=1 Tax=Chitinimonas sp. TaxID=1934313 RepID=UPI0035B0E4BC
MNIDYAHFTPWSALAGGILIGLAATGFAWLLGRVMGVSGIVAGLIWPRSSDRGWRLAFVGGLLASPWLWQLAFHLPSIELLASPGRLALAGLLVGIGTRYGSGCTSGHGVCGLARLSLRSLVATLCFMASGMLVVLFVRHVWGV